MTFSEPRLISGDVTVSSLFPSECCDSNVDVWAEEIDVDLWGE